MLCTAQQWARVYGLGPGPIPAIVVVVEFYNEKLSDHLFDPPGRGLLVDGVLRRQPV